MVMSVEGKAGKKIWSTPYQLEVLLKELVGWDSRSGTQGEIDFPYKLKDKFLELEYFKEQSDCIKFFDAGKGRNAFTALYKTEKTTDTVVLISHFDTVFVEEYGPIQEYAFAPDKLTEMLKSNIDMLPLEAGEDLLTGEYLFGRGTMDMKMGLALHMHIIEQAIHGDWPVNILLVTVPDEEVISSGMRAAVPGIVEIQQTMGLNIKLFLNSEPSFTQSPLDETHYIYSGSIGKILPGALFYGVPTHAGEPLSGMTSHFLSSYLTKKMEFSMRFMEYYEDETTPLPICLQANDLKDNYSVQTSHHSYAFYNVFTLAQTAQDVMTKFKAVAEEAMAECGADYGEICRQNDTAPIGEVKVLEYDELLNHFTEKHSAVQADELVKQVAAENHADERLMTVMIADKLMEYCQELAPAVVLFYAPPYMPAVNSSENLLVQKLIGITKSELMDNYNYEVTSKHYFNGICDLSYVNYNPADDGWQAYKNNAPLWGEKYSIPFEAMQQLTAPVMNIGPFGKDPHKMTERLHKKNAFEMMPEVLSKVIGSLF